MTTLLHPEHIAAFDTPGHFYLDGMMAPLNYFYSFEFHSRWFAETQAPAWCGNINNLFLLLLHLNTH